MQNSSHSVTAAPCPKAKHRRGFTLIEVTMALGILSFAMVGLVGLVPIALNGMQHSMKLTTEAQIIQRVVGDALVTEWKKDASGAYKFTPEKTQYHFDMDGVETANDDWLYKVDLEIPENVMLPGQAAISEAVAIRQVIKITTRYAPNDPKTFATVLTRTGT